MTRATRATNPVVVAGADKNRVINMVKGSKHTEEAKRLISIARSKALTGRKHSEETKRKIGLKSKGRKWTPERRANVMAGKRRTRLAYIGGEEGIPNIVRLYNEGMTIYSIAKKYNTSIYNITTILKEAGSL